MYVLLPSHYLLFWCSYKYNSQQTLTLLVVYEIFTENTKFCRKLSTWICKQFQNSLKLLAFHFMKRKLSSSRNFIPTSSCYILSFIEPSKWVILIIMRTSFFMQSWSTSFLFQMFKFCWDMKHQCCSLIYCKKNNNNFATRQKVLCGKS